MNEPARAPAVPDRRAGPPPDRRAGSPPGPPGPRRRIRTAALVAVGSELTTGATRDSNAAELAEALSAEGVEVVGIGLLPDQLDIVVAALSTALCRADLVVTTGGLGPTPDDLTREAIAAVCGEDPVVEPRLEAALRRRWRRRGLPYPAANVKQAWLIPSARPIPNPNGTAPGWWVERPDGRLVIALPGPPRELRPMWRDWVLGRLRRRGLGTRQVVRTLRTVGIGESQLVELLGVELLVAPNPRVATYARTDAVDVVVVARDEAGQPGRRGRRARTLAAATEAHLRAVLGEAVWGTDGDTWASVVGRLLGSRGWRLAARELGTGAALATLFETLILEGLLVRSEVVSSTVESTVADAGQAALPGTAPADAGQAALPGKAPSQPLTVGPGVLADRAEATRLAAGTEVGLVVQFAPAGSDALVSVGIADPLGRQSEERMIFGTGAQARIRAAVAAADVLRRRLLALPGDPANRAAAS